ncbi:hypothetical protein C9374_009410 [Naegleria lovaniensis]|uniref:Uncharacterized protein n=1 Tax=Naegleria lovaniensis TaxID=51637 RepID=A0AA88GDP0_NAELO|nr:uncharacterized protein C9374_009410 [Naegleria lovaniensis]KAG2377499.1 hypothetical protein C9374_009410 [Naegleria lovaniensis]
MKQALMREGFPTNPTTTTATRTQFHFMSRCVVFLLSLTFTAMVLMKEAKADFMENQILSTTDNDNSFNRYGSSLAMSNDGSYLAVSKHLSSVYIYYKSSSTSNYVHQHTISGKDFVTNPWGTIVGYQTPFNGIQSISLSGEGTTIAIGAPRYGTRGCVSVFSKRDPGASDWYSRQADCLTASYSSGTAQQYNDHFGYSVALSSDTSLLAVGAPNTDKGYVYLFSKLGSSYSLMTTLTSTDAEYQFGTSVKFSVDASVLVIGAKFKNNGQGAVYVFSKGNSTVWTQQQKILPPELKGVYRFGSSLAVSKGGSTIVVGSCEDSLNATDVAGSVYVFQKLGQAKEYTLSQRLWANDSVTGDRFGCSVAMSAESEVIIVGAHTRSHLDRTLTGAVYVFKQVEGRSWVQEQRIVPDSSNTDDNFGYAVGISLDGRTVASSGVKAPVNSVADSGKVYIYK